MIIFGFFFSDLGVSTIQHIRLGEGSFELDESSHHLQIDILPIQDRQKGNHCLFCLYLFKEVFWFDRNQSYQTFGCLLTRKNKSLSIVSGSFCQSNHRNH